MSINKNHNSKIVLVTGANGFIGRALCRDLLENGYVVRGAVRRCDNQVKIPNYDVVSVGNIGPETDWTSALKDVDSVIHLAARAHVIKETSSEPMMEYRKINLHATDSLARQAAKAGVRRFIYISSIGVNGNQTREKPFTEADYPSPQDPYALSKWEAEQALRRISETTNLKAVVVRLPLVYGPGVKGNMLRLLHLVYRCMPLPLGSINNSRSFIGVQNVADILIRCIRSQEAAGETFLVSDGEDVSTPELIRRIGVMLGGSARLFPFPMVFLRAGAKLFGKSDVLDRLCGSLVVDSSKVGQILKWSPYTSMNEGLSQMASWYLAEHAKRND